MFNKSHFVYATTLTLVVAHDIRAHFRNHRLIEFYNPTLAAKEEIIKGQQSQIEYLCSMLNKNGIDADEFDMIALNNPRIEE